MFLPITLIVEAKQMTYTNTPNYIHDLVNSYMYITKPCLIVGAGSVIFGTPGAVTGLSAYIIDQTLAYFNITTENYSSTIFTGAIWGYITKPSYTVSTFYGLFLGLSKSDYLRDVINTYIVENSLTYTALSIISGTTYYGLYGAVLFLAINQVEEALIHNYHTVDKHYAAYSMFTISILKFPTQYKIASIFASLFIGIILATCEDDLIANFKPFILTQDLYKVYSKIMHEYELKAFIKTYVENILLSQVFIQFSMTKLLKYQTDLTYNFEHLDNSAQGLLPLQKTVLDFLMFLLPHFFSILTSNTLKNYYSTQLYLELDIKLRDTLFQEQNLLYLSSNNNLTTIIDNFNEDSRVLLYDGSMLIADFLSKSTKGMYSIGLLASSSPDILIYSYIYKQCTKYITSLISEQKITLNSKIKEQQSLIYTNLKHDLQNILTINERSGIVYSKMNIDKLHSELKLNLLKKHQIDILYDCWQVTYGSLDLIFIFFLTGLKIHTGDINFDDRTIIRHSNWQAIDLLSWGDKRSTEIEKIYETLIRINSFFDIIENKTYACYPNVNRVPLDATKKFLYLENIHIIIGSKNILQIKQLTLMYNKTYALTGPSGSGKSTLIKTIIDKEQYPMCSFGTIYSPANTETAIISQQDYFPIGKTLEEVIAYPAVPNPKLSIKIQNLFDKIHLGQYKLDQIENWGKVLSGGEKKKIMALSAIIKEPDILILDEAFNGLDSHSIRIIQNLIKFYFADKLVISIDHNVQANNHTGFYDELLTIDNNTILYDKSKQYAPYSLAIDQNYTPYCINTLMGNDNLDEAQCLI